MQVGDRVKRIKSCPSNRLEKCSVRKGKVFTVREVALRGDAIYLEGDKYPWATAHFEKVKRPQIETISENYKI